MKIFRSLLDFYIQSSIHVSLAVTALAAVTLLEFGFTLELNLLAFVFLGTIVGYNFVKYAGVANLHHLEITPNIWLIRILSAGAFLGLIYVSFQLPLSVLAASGLFGALTILYAFPFYKGKNLRMLAGVKIYIIALVWAGTTVMVPLIQYIGLPILELVLEFLGRFMFVVALTLPFEIRDMKYDSRELGTLPQIIGIQKTRWLGITLMLSTLILTLLEPDISLEEALIMAVISIIMAAFLFKAKAEQGKYYSAFWVEGIPILWFILIYFQELYW